MSKQNTKLVIIGGGFSGVFTAKNIIKKFSSQQLKSIDIELISNHNYFVFQPLLPEVSSGIINPHDAVSPLRTLLPKIKHRLAEVKSIDGKNKKISVLQGRHKKIIHIDYDQLIIACGQESNLNLPGFVDHTLTMKDLGDAFLLRNHVLNCLELADVTLDAQIKEHALTFVIIGAGFSGIETAGELQDMVKKSLKYYPSIALDEIHFIVVQKDKRILTQLTQSLSSYAHRKLTQRNIDIRLDTGVTQATEKYLITDTDEKIYTHTIITTIGNGPRDFISRSFELEYGKIPVDGYMASTQYDDIWALGDVALIPMDEQKTGMKYAPPTAQFAVQEANIISQNIKAVLFGQTKQVFNFSPLGLMASLGAYQGVIEIGKIRLSGILAWAMWRGIYVVKLPGFIAQLRVTLNWFMDYIFPRTLVQVSPVSQRSIKRAHFIEGDIIHQEGDLITHFSLILSGKVICKNTQEQYELGKQAILCRHIEDYQSSYQHTITALDKTTLLLVPRDEFLLLKNNFNEFNKILG